VRSGLEDWCLKKTSREKGLLVAQIRASLGVTSLVLLLLKARTGVNIIAGRASEINNRMWKI